MDYPRCWYVPCHIDPFVDEGELKFLTNEQVALYEDAVRKPEFDSFASLGFVPASELLAKGWSVRCCWCEDQIDGDMQWIEEGRAIWCSHNCKQEDHEAAERRSANKAILKEWLETHWPFLEDVKLYTGGPGPCKNECFNRNRENAFAKFGFPGSSIGNNHACLGCRKLWICRGDAEAWAKLTG